jgi:hypothetical protein
MQFAIEFLNAQPGWMKAALLSLVVLALIWLILAAGYYRTPPSVLTPPQSGNGPSQGSIASSVEAPASASPPSGTKQPLTINSGDLLVLTGQQGIAVVEISFHEDCKASYRWRHSFSRGGQETSGQGQLFEQYGTSSPPGAQSRHVSNVGGELLIKAGPYSIEWSCGSSEKGYVFARSQDVDALRVEGKSFSEFQL